MAKGGLRERSADREAEHIPYQAAGREIFVCPGGRRQNRPDRDSGPAWERFIAPIPSRRLVDGG